MSGYDCRNRRVFSLWWNVVSDGELMMLIIWWSNCDSVYNCLLTNLQRCGVTSLDAVGCWHKGQHWSCHPRKSCPSHQRTTNKRSPNQGTCEYLSITRTMIFVSQDCSVCYHISQQLTLEDNIEISISVTGGKEFCVCSTPCPKNKTANLFLSELRQIFANFDNFLQKDGKEAKIMRYAFVFHLTQLASSHYRVKCRCSKLLHNAESCYL